MPQTVASEGSTPCPGSACPVFEASPFPWPRTGGSLCPAQQLSPLQTPRLRPLFQVLGDTGGAARLVGDGRRLWKCRAVAGHLVPCSQTRRVEGRHARARTALAPKREKLDDYFLPHSARKTNTSFEAVLKDFSDPDFIKKEKI